MQPLEAAILRTVLYADVFNFPMKLEEIHHFLISDDPVSLAEILAAQHDAFGSVDPLESHLVTLLLYPIRKALRTE